MPKTILEGLLFAEDALKREKTESTYLSNRCSTKPQLSRLHETVAEYLNLDFVRLLFCDSPVILIRSMIFKQSAPH